MMLKLRRSGVLLHETQLDSDLEIMRTAEADIRQWTDLADKDGLY